MRTQPGGAITRLSGRKQLLPETTSGLKLIHSFTTEFSQVMLGKLIYLSPVWQAPAPQICPVHHFHPCSSLIAQIPLHQNAQHSIPHDMLPFNSGSCRYGNMCKFHHMCSICSGGHPKVACKANKPFSQGSKEQKMPHSKQ